MKELETRIASFLEVCKCQEIDWTIASLLFKLANPSTQAREVLERYSPKAPSAERVEHSKGIDLCKPEYITRMVRKDYLDKAIASWETTISTYEDKEFLKLNIKTYELTTYWYKVVGTEKEVRILLAGYSWMTPEQYDAMVSHM